jgi:hypothetical protein
MLLHSRLTRILGWGVLVAATCVLAVSRSVATPATGVADETLMTTFDDDMRDVVYRWSPDDPRSGAERRKALFDFVYQTYESSAWIPQSLFDRNLVTQAVIGSVDTIVRDQVGLVLWRDNALVPAFGMAPNREVGRPLRWTVNCLVCLRRRHQAVRRQVPRRRAEAPDERPVAPVHVPRSGRP